MAIYTLDGAATVTSWNPGAEAMYGYPAAEARGLSTETLHTPEDQRAGVVPHEMDEALRAGRSACERWKVRRDQTRFWTSGVLMPLLDEGRAVGFLKIERDATLQHEAQDARLRLLAAERDARHEAEDASAAKDRFLAALSHELRTPLTPMKIGVFALEREKRLSTAGREMVRMIGRNLDAEVRLIDDLLDVSRIVHGKLEFKHAPTDVHGCLRRAVEACVDDLRAKEQGLAVALDARDHTLHGDADRLRQVFCNLLQNAAKFTPPGGSVRLRSFNPEPGHLAVEVSDNGMGIEASALPEIFAPSNRAARRSFSVSAAWASGWPSRRRWSRRTMGG